MKLTTIIVDNLKCNGCVNTVNSGLENTPGIHTIEIDLVSSEVKIQHDEELSKAELLRKLSELGYPEKSTTVESEKSKGVMDFVWKRFK